MPEETLVSASTSAPASPSIFSTIGLSKEREYFIENLSMLVAAGMPILNVLDSIAKELHSDRMKKIILLVREDIESGFPIWKALQKTGLFASHTISLIRLGEESGNLVENLKVVAIEQEKESAFQSKLRSAMTYPILVLSLTMIIGIGVAWFILPKLAQVFGQLKITLPLITKILIGTGVFLGDYGIFVIPAAVIAMAAILFFTFIYSKTKFIGQYILFFLPGIKTLIKEIEIARFSYLLGTLLQAGMPITQALNSLTTATEITPYQKLYEHLRDKIQDGNSFQKCFATYEEADRLIPAPIQQLIVAGEQSGTLAETLLKIGHTYEMKSDASTKNLTVILEPVLLIIVWLGVVTVALAVILPIYSLIGGFKT